MYGKVAILLLFCLACNALQCSMAQTEEGVPEDSSCYFKLADFSFTLETLRNEVVNGAWEYGRGILSTYFDGNSPGWFGTARLENLNPSKAYRLSVGTEGTCADNEYITSALTPDSDGTMVASIRHHFSEESFDFNVLRLSEGDQSCDEAIAVGRVNPIRPGHSLRVQFPEEEFEWNNFLIEEGSRMKSSDNPCPFAESWRDLDVHFGEDSVVLTEYGDGLDLEASNCAVSASGEVGFPIWQFWKRGEWHNGGDLDEENWLGYSNPNIDQSPGHSPFFVARLNGKTCQVGHRFSSMEQADLFFKTIGNSARAFVKLTLAQGNGENCDIELRLRRAEVRRLMRHGNGCGDDVDCDEIEQKDYTEPQLNENNGRQIPNNNPRQSLPGNIMAIVAAAAGFVIFALLVLYYVRNRSRSDHVMLL